MSGLAFIVGCLFSAAFIGACGLALIGRDDSIEIKRADVILILGGTAGAAVALVSVSFFLL